MYFWDFPRALWTRLSPPPKKILTMSISITLAFLIAYIIEFFILLLSPFKEIHPTFTLFRVKLFAVNRYFDGRKAQKLLGYNPKISLDKGINRTVEWINKEGLWKFNDESTRIKTQ